MKYRIKFSKTGKIRFIGHLDLLKVFQRAIKRGEIPISYSKGFNPHQIIGFALPLPLGMTSESEYADIETDWEIPAEEIMKRLNNVMPEGIKIIAARKLSDSDKRCAAEVTAALYEIILDGNIADFSEIVKDMFLQEKFEIEKTGKRKTTLEDIKPDIFSVKEIQNASATAFKTVISAGSRKNLKPELLVEYIYKYINRKYEPFKINYKRLELFGDCGGELLPLQELK